MEEMLLAAKKVLLGPVGQVLHNGAVLVRGNKILAVGQQLEIEAMTQGEVRYFWFPEGTILPGLIDAHVHLAFDASEDPIGTLLRAKYSQVFAAMADRARRLLDVGVTTVRDLGDRLGLAVALREKIANGSLMGPRILSAGTPLTSRRGHCWFLGGEVEGIDQIRAQVRDVRANGADLVKVMVTGGRLTSEGPPPWETQFSTAELRALVAEAHALGVRVSAHAHATEGIAQAVEAGVHTIEHCRWLTTRGVSAPSAVVDGIIKGGIFICPTVNKNWTTLRERMDPSVADKLLELMANHHRMGMLFIAGTDAGIPSVEVTDYVSGLKCLAYIGLSPGEIIEAATVRASEALGLAGQVGRLSSGMCADILVIDGNPLCTLDALASVRMVIIDGRLHKSSMTL